MFEKNIPEIGGGPPFFEIFGNCQKLSKSGLPACPEGNGRRFLTSWTPPTGVRLSGRGGGGVPPLAEQTDVKPALWVYRPVQEHYGSSHTHTN